MARRSVPKSAVAPRVGNEQPQLGMIRKALPRPEFVAEMTMTEALELKERKRIIEAKSTESEDLTKLVALLRNEYTTFIRKMLDGRNLPDTDDYNVDTESGRIFRTATLEPVTPTVDEPSVDATTDAAEPVEAAD